MKSQMLRIKICVVTLLVALVCFPVASVGQLWSGVLAPSRAIDWSGAGSAIQARATICATLNPGATAAQINSAVAGCPAGQVVMLNAGTYSLNASIIITKSNVTLRGAGPNQTFLVFAATNTNCNGLGGTSICIWNGDSEYSGGPGNVANWTAGYAKGTFTITLSSTSNLKVGSLLVLDQLDPAADTGNIWVCQSSGTSPSCSQQGANGVARAGRGQSQQVTVTGCGTTTPGASCTGTTVTISPGLYAPNWSAAQTPQGWYSSTLPVSGVGIENLSVDYSALGDQQAGIMFSNASQCWVRNLRSINAVAANAATRKHVLMWQSSHITVRDSYFYGSSPTSEGYGADAGSVSSDILVENNIFQHIATATINEGATGIVFGYNYAVDNYYNNGAPNWQQQDGFHHSVGDSFILWEGHEGTGFNADTIHGTSFMITHFRDYLSGHDPATEVGAKTQATFAYFPFAFSRYFNLVGSVLGTQSYHTTYKTAAPNATDCGNATAAALSVLVLGYSDQAGIGFSVACGFAFDIPNDTLVASTLMAWGNYAACTGDTACNAVRWQTSENASGAPVYPGLSAPSQQLPASFYVAAKPSWWGTMPWPAVGPDVTGGNIPNVGGHAYHNPAANCYLNVMAGKVDGSSGPLTFNPTSCYAASPPPAAPTNLTAVVQ